MSVWEEDIGRWTYDEEHMTQPEEDECWYVYIEERGTGIQHWIGDGYTEDEAIVLASRMEYEDSGVIVQIGRVW